MEGGRTALSSAKGSNFDGSIMDPRASCGGLANEAGAALENVLAGEVQQCLVPKKRILKAGRAGRSYRQQQYARLSLVSAAKRLLLPPERVPQVARQLRQRATGGPGGCSAMRPRTRGGRGRARLCLDCLPAHTGSRVRR